MSEDIECKLCGGSGEVELVPMITDDGQSDYFGCPACLQRDHESALQSSREEAERLYQALNGVAKELGIDFLRPEFAEASAALSTYTANKRK